MAWLASSPYRKFLYASIYSQNRRSCTQNYQIANFKAIKVQIYDEKFKISVIFLLFIYVLAKKSKADNNANGLDIISENSKSEDENYFMSVMRNVGFCFKETVVNMNQGDDDLIFICHFKRGINH